MIGRTDLSLHDHRTGSWRRLVRRVPGQRRTRRPGRATSSATTSKRPARWVRSVPRGAYAIDGASPAHVIAQLDRLVDTFSLTQLVTVVYGVLEPATPDGHRLLRYTNAGHLPPMLRHPDGCVDTLAGGSSVVIGAPITDPTSQAEQWIPPGSTLILFTDGLVAAPGRSLDEALEQVAATVAQGAADSDALRNRVLAAMPAGTLRDDVVVLAVGVTPTPATLRANAPPGSARELASDH